MFKKFAVIAFVTASIGVAHAHGDYQQPKVGFYVTPQVVSVTFGNPYYPSVPRPYYDDRYREYHYQHHHHEHHRGYGYYEPQRWERM